MKAVAPDGVLSVNLSTAIPAASKRVETRSGFVRWALLDETLLIQPERDVDPTDTPHIEHLIRAVMKSSGLARRYQIFLLRGTDVRGR